MNILKSMPYVYVNNFIMIQVTLVSDFVCKIIVAFPLYLLWLKEKWDQSQTNIASGSNGNEPMFARWDLIRF